MMWAFFSRRLRMWLLLAVALPLARGVIHRLALATERRDPAGRATRVLHRADAVVTAASQRASRRNDRRRIRR